MGNQILTGLDLLRAREQLKIENRRAEEQREIENVQAQKDQSLREKEQKRRQQETDLNSQVLERKFALDTAIERLQFEEGQAIGRTPSEATFQLPEVSEEFTGPREGGVIGRQDTSGLADPFGTPAFQPEDRQNELIQAFGVNQQLQALQQREKALNSPTVLAGQQAGLFRADLAENARIDKIKSAKELQKDKVELEGLKGINRLEAVERRGQLRKQEKAVEARFGGPRVIRGKAASVLHGNSNLTGSATYKAAVMHEAQELGTQLAVEMGFNPNEAAQVAYQDITTAQKKDISELAPILTTLDEMHDLLMEGIQKGWFPDTLAEASIRAALETGKNVFGVSEFTIRLESLLGRAATVSRSVGEKRFTEGDIARAIFLMTRPGLNAEQASRRFDTMRDTTNFIYDLKTRGIHPIQQAIVVGPEFISMLQGSSQTSGVLKANASSRGPNERPVKDTEGNLLWFDTKTGETRERSK